VEDPAQAPLLPLARRAVRQSHSRIADPWGIIGLERAHCRAAADRGRERFPVGAGRGHGAGGQPPESD